MENCDATTRPAGEGAGAFPPVKPLPFDSAWSGWVVEGLPVAERLRRGN
jgi:hypothetical protein